MTLKKVTIHFQMSDEMLASLRADYSNIIKHIETEYGKTVFIVDVTPTQESQVVPALRNRIQIVTIEDTTWTPPPGPTPPPIP